MTPRQALPNFPHRHNADGSHDSICTKCFQTVASVRDEATLAEREKKHQCDPYILYRFSQTFGKLDYFEKRTEIN
ncbi:MAG TPA: hypothetical protein VK716_08920 [Terracidiphilus sp.]|jgi:hypothetical protein|nr:hypothetical protein [Terracidiphilus sp.]